MALLLVFVEQESHARHPAALCTVVRKTKSRAFLNYGVISCTMLALSVL